MITWLTVATIGLPWLGAVIVWLAGDGRPRLQHGLAAGFAVVAGLAALAMLPFTNAEPVLNVAMGSVFGEFTLVADGLGVFLAIVATVIGSLAVIFSIYYMHGEAQLGRYYALVLLFIGAMAGLVLAGSILFMFFFWEITAFCSYALIAFHNDDPKAVAGGIKALIVTQLGGIGLLAGALVIYAYLGSYQIDTFLGQAQGLPAGILALIAFGYLAAAIAKSAQVPLHTWLPDAMEAPTPVTALIHAATMVNAGVYLLARFYPAFAEVPGWKTAVVSVGLLSALLAAIMGLVANDLKRALAYSTISQLGYMVYAVGVGAIFASQLHLMSHAVFKALLFLAAGAIIHTLGTRDMRQMGGLRLSMRFVWVVFAIGSLGLIGLPIANGFFSKELLLDAGLAYGPLWAYIGMLLGVVMTTLYTLRMVSLVFYGQASEQQPAHPPPDAMRFRLSAMRFSLGVLAIGVLTTWLLAGPFSQLLARSLPFHSLESETTIEIVVEILTAPATWLALAVIALAAALWLLRDRLAGLSRALQPIAGFAAEGLGFEWINQQIIGLAKGASALMSRTQTGQLNWNVAGIVGGLAVVLALLLWGIA